MPASKKPPSTCSQTSGRSDPLTVGSSAHDFADGNKSDSDQAPGGTTTRDSAAQSATDCDPMLLAWRRRYQAHGASTDGQDLWPLPSLCSLPSSYRLPSLYRPDTSGIQSGSQSPERAHCKRNRVKTNKLPDNTEQREKARGKPRERQVWLFGSKAQQVTGERDAPDSKLAKTPSKPKAERDPH